MRKITITNKETQEENSKNIGIMYDKYLSMSSVPAGKILERILRKQKLSQKELAEKSGEYQTRISEYINGKRKFTIKSSIAIEKALHIEIEGFFFKLQTNHEIYNFVAESELQFHPDLSKLSKSLFWDTRIEKINWIRNKKWVIKRALEYGNKEEIKEIVSFYGRDTVLSILPEIDSRWNKEQRTTNIQQYVI